MRRLIAYLQRIHIIRPPAVSCLPMCNQLFLMLKVVLDQDTALTVAFSLVFRFNTWEKEERNHRTKI